MYTNHTHTQIVTRFKVCIMSSIYFLVLTMSLLVKSLLSWCFVALIIYISWKQWWYIWWLLNALPVIAGSWFLMLHFSWGSTRSYTDWLLLWNIPYMIFCFILWYTIHKNIDPIVSFCVALWWLWASMIFLSFFR